MNAKVGKAGPNMDSKLVSSTQRLTRHYIEQICASAMPSVEELQSIDNVSEIVIEWVKRMQFRDATDFRLLTPTVFCGGSMAKYTCIQGRFDLELVVTFASFNPAHSAHKNAARSYITGQQEAKWLGEIRRGVQFELKNVKVNLLFMGTDERKTDIVNDNSDPTKHFFVASLVPKQVNFVLKHVLYFTGGDCVKLKASSNENNLWKFKGRASADGHVTITALSGGYFLGNRIISRGTDLVVSLNDLTPIVPIFSVVGDCILGFKQWIKLRNWGSYSAPPSYLLELLVIHAAAGLSLESNAACAPRLRCLLFLRSLDLLTRIQELQICSGHPASAGRKHKMPYVLDPANPENNLLKNFRADYLDFISGLAEDALEQLPESFTDSLEAYLDNSSSTSRQFFCVAKMPREVDIDPNTFPKQEEKKLVVESNVFRSTDGYAFSLLVQFSVKPGAGAVPSISAYICLKPSKCLPEVQWPCTRTFQIRLLAADTKKQDIVRELVMPHDQQCNGPNATCSRRYEMFKSDTVIADYVAQDTAVFSVTVF